MIPPFSAADLMWISKRVFLCPNTEHGQNAKLLAAYSREFNHTKYNSDVLINEFQNTYYQVQILTALNLFIWNTALDIAVLLGIPVYGPVIIIPPDTQDTRLRTINP